MIARPSPAAPVVGASTSNRSSITRPSAMLMRRRQKEKRFLLISIVGALFLLVCIQIFMVYPMILPNTPQLAFTSGWGAKDSHVADIAPPRRKAIRPLLETGRAPPLWTPILENSLIGYSAHWDVRALHGMKPPYVRIIATSIAFHQSGGHPHMYNDKHFKCKYYYENDTTTGEYDGQIMHFGPRESFFILCPAHDLVQNGTKDVPASLYLSCEKCEGHWNYEIWGSEALSVITEGEEMERGDIAVCVRPAYGPWNNALDLIQFLIYYTQAGVNHFTFYSSRAMVPEMTKVVRKAQEIGISVEILPWNCQYSYDGYHIEEYNQYTGINACVYWQMAYYKHVAIIDLDELIAERRHFIEGPEPPEEEEDSNLNSNLLEEEIRIENDEKRKEERKKRRLLKRVMVEKELTEEEVKQMKEEEKEKLIDEQKEKERLARGKWENGTRPLPELLQELNTEHPGAGAFQFLNYFFFPYEERDESLEELTLPFDLFHYTKRHGPFPSGIRSKTIIKPERVVSADIHSTNRFAGPYSEVVVDKKVASIFHYRKGNHVQSPGSVERDDEMLKFYDAVKEHPMLPALLEAVGRQANGTVFPAVKEEGEEVVEEGEEKQEGQLKKEQEQKEGEEKEKLEQAKKEEEERKKVEQAEKEEEETKKVEEARKEEEERKKAEEAEHQQQGEQSTQEEQAKEKEEDAKGGTMDGEKEGEKEVEKEGGKDREERDEKQAEEEAGR